MKVTQYRFVPTLMASVLAVALVGCSSSGSSYSPDHVADKAKQEEQKAKEKIAHERAEAEKVKAEADKQVKEQAEKAHLEAEKAKQEAEKARVEAEKTKAETDKRAKELEENVRLEADKAKEDAEKARLEAEQKVKEQKLAWRHYEVISSNDGGYKYEPTKLAGKEGVYYSSGPIVLSKGGKAVKLDNSELQYDRDFLKNGELDSNKVQHLEITDTDGTVLGKFQFVNQDYSSYATFVSAKPSNQYGSIDKIEPLAFYTAKLSTESQLAQQKGTFDYNGKAIGYQGGVKGGTPTQEAVADVHFEVNFDTKKIKGEMTNRFDGLTKNAFGLTKGWDKNDDPIYYPEHNDPTRSLILKETDIKVENGVVGFGHNGVVDSNAGIIAGGKLRDVTDYGGVFAGPNLENIVGQIGGGEERIMFGATKADAPKTEASKGEQK
ncbi:hypothetical protein A6B43_04060 [Vespertiliibacter pulmonis]|uniref:Transferrin-binding protein B C-lobe/N-lobe beta barrel domain-containing protein n=1 Tax=Vespertiliibacter pulmonis TaxID=1443036 RepID=A0A3N4W960_9PAST|nr:cell envelope integrity protein TolA [Vespertiliibacter pulmonis]QLB20754.1 hypothetical protein A6B43_04060 [Vespertiliibacter pulmonis]RPE82640.1 hypothetical protein EDC46_1578 [Vespertiliibacter pulmonis]